MSTGSMLTLVQPNPCEIEAPLTGVTNAPAATGIRSTMVAASVVAESITATFTVITAIARVMPEPAGACCSVVVPGHAAWTARPGAR